MATASTWLARSRPSSREGRTAILTAAAQTGLLSRLRRHMDERRRQRAERLIAGLIERNGGQITDGIEREIGARSLGA